MDEEVRVDSMMQGQAEAAEGAETAPADAAAAEAQGNAGKAAPAEPEGPIEVENVMAEEAPETAGESVSREQAAAGTGAENTAEAAAPEAVDTAEEAADTPAESAGAADSAVTEAESAADPAVTEAGSAADPAFADTAAQEAADAASEAVTGDTGRLQQNIESQVDGHTSGSSIFDENGRYSWVNPKLRGSAGESTQNPWDTGNGSYWQAGPGRGSVRGSGRPGYNTADRYPQGNEGAYRTGQSSPYGSAQDGAGAYRSGQSGPYSSAQDGAGQYRSWQSGTYHSPQGADPYRSGADAYRGPQNSDDPKRSSQGGPYTTFQRGGSAYQGGSRENGPYSAGPQGYAGQGDDPRRARRNLSGIDPVPGESRVRSTGGAGRRWAGLVAMAVVFGLIAGLVTYGVNLAANAVHPIVPEESAAAQPEEAEQSVETETPTAEDAAEAGDVEAQDGTPMTDTSGDRDVTDIGDYRTVADVAAEAMPAMVTISTMSVQEMQSFFGGTQRYEVSGAGSGVIIGENETELLIATNNHVVEGAQTLSVGFVDESAIEGVIKGTDEENDLAVVAVRLEDIPEETQNELKIIAIGKAEDLVLGERVVAIGNALGYGQSVTAGYISALHRSMDFSDGQRTFTSTELIQTDAAINSGNSGGALLNMRGELIGINEAKSSSGGYTEASVDNMGFAISMEKAKPILERLMNMETPELIPEEERGLLGVEVTEVTEQYSQMYNMPVGVCFTSVVPGGPAEKAGALKGDVLVGFANVTIKSYSALQKQMQYHRAGETVDVTVMRANDGEYREISLSVTLASSEEVQKLIEANAAESSSEEEDAVPEEPEAPDAPEMTQPDEQQGGGQQMPDSEEMFEDIFGRLFGF